MKKKQAKLFIPVLYTVKFKDKEDYSETRATLLNASKIPLLKDIIPDVETLKTHMQIQRLEVEKDKKYQPKPFEIKLEKSKFTEIINHIKAKNKDAASNQISLVTQWPAIPLVVITELRR